MFYAVVWGSCFCVRGGGDFGCGCGMFGRVLVVVYGGDYEVCLRLIRDSLSASYHALLFFPSAYKRTISKKLNVR